MTKRTLRIVPTPLSTDMLRAATGGIDVSVKFPPWIVRNKKGDGDTTTDTTTTSGT